MAAVATVVVDFHKARERLLRFVNDDEVARYEMNAYLCTFFNHVETHMQSLEQCNAARARAVRAADALKARVRDLEAEREQLIIRLRRREDEMTLVQQQVRQRQIQLTNERRRFATQVFMLRDLVQHHGVHPEFLQSFSDEHVLPEERERDAVMRRFIRYDRRKMYEKVSTAMTAYMNGFEENLTILNKTVDVKLTAIARKMSKFPVRCRRMITTIRTIRRHKTLQRLEITKLLMQVNDQKCVIDRLRGERNAQLDVMPMVTHTITGWRPDSQLDFLRHPRVKTVDASVQVAISPPCIEHTVEERPTADNIVIEEVNDDGDDAVVVDDDVEQKHDDDTVAIAQPPPPPPSQPEKAPYDSWLSGGMLKYDYKDKDLSLYTHRDTLDPTANITAVFGDNDDGNDFDLNDMESHVVLYAQQPHIQTRTTTTARPQSARMNDVFNRLYNASHHRRPRPPAPPSSSTHQRQTGGRYGVSVVRPIAYRRIRPKTAAVKKKKSRVSSARRPKSSRRQRRHVPRSHVS